MKGQHLLNLGPQLFKHTYSAQEENKTKGQLQSPGAIKSQTATQTPATKYKTPTLQKGEANTASQPALSLLQKDGPHHVLLAPSVYAEVNALAKSKSMLESKFSGWFANSTEQRDRGQRNPHLNLTLHQTGSRFPWCVLSFFSVVFVTSILHYIKQVDHTHHNCQEFMKKSRKDEIDDCNHEDCKKSPSGCEGKPTKSGEE